MAEAKANLTLREARQWMAYRQRRGSFNLGLRLEEGFGNVLSTLHNALGKNKTPPEKFMPHVVPPKKAEPDVEQVFAVFKAMASANNGADADAPAKPAKRRGRRHAQKLRRSHG